MVSRGVLQTKHAARHESNTECQKIRYRKAGRGLRGPVTRTSRRAMDAVYAAGSARPRSTHSSAVDRYTVSRLTYPVSEKAANTTHAATDRVAVRRDRYSRRAWTDSMSIPLITENGESEAI